MTQREKKVLRELHAKWCLRAVKRFACADDSRTSKSGKRVMSTSAIVYAGCALDLALAMDSMKQT